MALPLVASSVRVAPPPIVYALALSKFITPTVCGAASITVRGAVMTEPKFATSPANIGTPPVQLDALYQLPSASRDHVGADKLNPLTAGRALPFWSNSAIAPPLKMNVLGTWIASGYHHTTPCPRLFGRFRTALRRSSSICCWPAGVEAHVAPVAAPFQG